jgi:glutamyl/glutaminyl-tRNA synthetase
VRFAPSPTGFLHLGGLRTVMNVVESVLLLI